MLKQPMKMNHTPQQTLLIVDDTPPILRMLTKGLNSYFNTVFTARSQEEAEIILKRHRITHIICDFNLGIHSKNGFDLLTIWRSEHSDIKRAVVFTGEHISNLTKPNAVDAILSKHSEIKEIYKCLE